MTEDTSSPLTCPSCSGFHASRQAYACMSCHQLFCEAQVQQTPEGERVHFINEPFSGRLTFCGHALASIHKL